jgi:hypothetical protein
MNPRTILSAVALAGLAAAQAPTEVRGELPKGARWTGTVKLTGDVTVPADGSLEIAPGTRVLVAPQDSLQQGWNTDLIEIHCKGQLLVAGTLETPVVVTHEAAVDGGARISATPTWHGFVLHPRKDEVQRRDSLRGMRIEYAFAGIQVPDSNPQIEDCVLRFCMVGVEVGSAYRNQRFTGRAGGAAGPEVRRCRFTECQTGVYATGQAVPYIERSVFHRCGLGVGPRRPGYTNFLQRPGCSVQRCVFVNCSTGIVGCSLTRDSIFAETARALELSDYHDRLADRVEHVLFEHCLVTGTADPVAGDTAVGRDVIRGEPGFRGPLSDLQEAWPPLPKCLELNEGSAAIGAASDGADLGVFGVLRFGAGMVGLAFSGAPLEAGLAAPFDAPNNWQKLAKLQAGVAAGKTWWARADIGKGGFMQLRRTFGLARTGGLLAFELQAAAAGTVKLMHSGDTEGFEVAVNGRSAGSLAARRRFGTAGAPIELKLEAGANLVLVHVRGRGSDPRLALTIDGAAEVVAPVPPPPADAVTCTAKATRQKDGVFIELSLSAATHWAAADGTPMATVRIKGGEDAQAVDASWTAARKLRLGPIRAPAKSELEIALPGLRDLLGAPLRVEPVALKV